MMMNLGKVIKINATHSHTKIVLQEIRFHDGQTLNEVKEVLSRKFGTLPEYMKLKLIKKEGEEKPLGQYDEEKKLSDLGIEDYDTIHVIDLNPNGELVQNNIDDVSTVKKYEISEEDYLKRPGNIREFRKKLMKDPEYKKKVKESQGPTYEEEAKKIKLGDRCIIGDGTRRGEIKYVGKCSELGHGYFIGIALDEPMGDMNGTIKEKKYFEVENNYGLMVRPNFVKIGNYPPIDEFNENEDEI